MPRKENNHLVTVVVFSELPEKGKINGGVFSADAAREAIHIFYLL